MSPTVNMSAYEFKAFLSRWPTIIKRVNKASRYIELLSGYKIYFRAETEGQRAVLGLHADIISSDKFATLQGKKVSE